MKTLNKPLYKQLIELGVNIQDGKKVENFKKEKWEIFINAYKGSGTRFGKFGAKDQNRYLTSHRPTKHFSYKNGYKNIGIERKKLKLVYGHLTNKYLKRILIKQHKQKCIHTQSEFLDIFERRIDTTLYRVKFASSVKSASQTIFQNKILVNFEFVRGKSYILDPSDVVAISSKHLFGVQQNIRSKNTQKWPIPPKYLIINYSILQFILGFFRTSNLSFNSFYHLNLEKLCDSLGVMWG